MLTERHKELAGKIWEIANRLRGPYRPPQYRLVMLPLVVLRRLDCVLEPTKDAVLKEHKRLKAALTPEKAWPRLLTKIVDKKRKQPLYNTSSYTSRSFWPTAKISRLILVLTLGVSPIRHSVSSISSNSATRSKSWNRAIGFMPSFRLWRQSTCTPTASATLRWVTSLSIW